MLRTKLGTQYTELNSSSSSSEKVPDVSIATYFHMGGCQNDGPFLGTLNNRCRIITGTQKGTIILTITHTPPTLCSDYCGPVLKIS